MFKNILKSWIPLATTITFLSGLVYVTAHQNFRQSANDPQIQIARDTANLLSQGKTANELSGRMDIGKSLAPFVIIFDDAGKPVTASGELHGKIPTPPSGVFDYTKMHTEDRITWQPESGVRIATVITHYTSASSSGYVLVGRSLEEIEKRVAQLTWHIGLGWIVTLLVSLGAVIIGEKIGS